MSTGAGAEKTGPAKPATDSGSTQTAGTGIGAGGAVGPGPAQSGTTGIGSAENASPGLGAGAAGPGPAQTETPRPEAPSAPSPAIGAGAVAGPGPAQTETPRPEAPKTPSPAIGAGAAAGAGPAQPGTLATGSPEPAENRAAAVQDRPATVVRVRFRLPGRLWLVILPVVLVAPLALLLGTGYVYGPSPPVAVDLSGLPEEAASLRREAERLRGEGRRIDARLRRTAPASAYIVIDHNENRLHLRKGDRLLRTVIVSCGSGRVLEEQGGQNRVWVFNTPLGLHRVLYKKADPVWKKPDWAFIEEGEPIPEDPSLRFEYGALGEYGLYFGDGYLIHGTLYERLLGRSVTHGCVRVGKDDLRELFYAVPLGTPIFIH